MLKSVASRQAFLSEPPPDSVRVHAEAQFVAEPDEVIFGVIMRKVIGRGLFTSVADLR